MKKILSIILCFILISTLVFLVSNLILKPNFENPLTIVNQEKVYVADKLIKVPKICQYPELPTGCESVSATMVLQYYEVNVTPKEFAGSWLTCSDDFYNSKGELHGPNPNDVFVGSPFTKNSYGCFTTPIVNAINSNSSTCTAHEIIGKSLEDICDEFIDENNPVLIWATMNMKQSKKGTSWYLEDGSSFTWTAGEHCLVLVGYNSDYYFLNDPMTGGTVAFEKHIVEQRYAELGQQAVYVSKEKLEL